MGRLIVFDGIVHTAGLSGSGSLSSLSGGIGLVDDQALGGQYAGCDGSSVLQGGAGHLGGVNDTCADHVNIGLGVSVVAEAILLGGADRLAGVRRLPARAYLLGAGQK